MKNRVILRKTAKNGENGSKTPENSPKPPKIGFDFVFCVCYNKGTKGSRTRKSDGSPLKQKHKTKGRKNNGSKIRKNELRKVL